MGQDKTEVLYTKAVIVSTKKKIFSKCFDVSLKIFQIFFFQIFGLYGKKISSIMNT